jgi:perosamine synthetase
LALIALGIGPGDEVILPDFTMIASAFAVCYVGAKPVFVDAHPQTWNIDPALIEAKITSKTKAIMPVHIFGLPCDMDKIQKIADKHNLFVLEDAAEAHGAEYNHKKAGSLSDVATFSFFSNKNLTTGEGGMVVTNQESIYNKVRYFKNMCFQLDAPRVYLHHDIGFNYRMSNVHAAIGLAQVEKADEYRQMRINNGFLYRSALKDIPGISFQENVLNSLNVCWMNGVLVDPQVYGRTRDELINFLTENDIETRLFFIGMHKQPCLLRYGCTGEGDFSFTDKLTENGFYLPSASTLTTGQIEFICDKIQGFRRK